MPTFCSGDWAAGTVLGFCVWTSRCHSIMCTFCVCLGLGVKKHLVKRVGFWFTEQHREHFCTSRKYGSLIMEWKGHWTTCLFFSTFFYSLLSFDRTSGLFLCFRCNHQLKEVCKNGGNKIHSGCRKKKHAASLSHVALMWASHPPYYIVSSVSYCPLHHNYAPPHSFRPPPTVFMLTLNHLSAPGAYFSADESMATPLIAQFITWSPPDIYRERCGGKQECIHLVKSQNTSPTANGELNFLFVCVHQPLLANNFSHSTAGFPCSVKSDGIQ